MDSVNYDDFKNICRVCLSFCEHKFVQDNAVSDMYYMIMGIRFETNDQLPKQICLECFEHVIKLNEFALKCKQSHRILIKCLENIKNEGLNANMNVENIYTGDDEIKIEEHKIEFVDVDEENVFTNELQIKSEQTEEIISKQNVNSVQDDVSIEYISSEVSVVRPKTKRKHSQHSFECDICNKKFTSSSALYKHKPIHRGEHPFMCEICNKSYTKLSNLTQHKRVHSGERPYSCDICNKSFIRASILITHKRTHSGERPYVCEICNKSFINSSNLISHKRVHSGERPFVCDICNKSFNQSSNLYLHKRIHSGERPFECEICSKSFTLLSGLKSHKYHKHVHSEICNQ